MPSLHIEHAITDLDTWQNAFDPLHEVRRQAGVVAEVVRQPVDDPNRIALDLEFDTLEHASAFLDFLQTHIWPVPENAPALLGTPTATVLDTIARSAEAPEQAKPGWMTIVDWPGGRLETFAELQATHHDHDHTGLLARYCSQLPDSLRIIAIWESEAAANQFFEQLPAANRARLAPATDGTPSITGTAIHHSLHPG
jgi:hypothetical protein